MLFSLKDKKFYPSCKIYYEKCKQCEEDYVGEMKRNCITRWREHYSPTHESKLAIHINNHVEHLRKNLEALFIGVLKSSLKEQTNFEF